MASPNLGEVVFDGLNEAASAANCEFVVADAMTVDTVVPEPADYVFLANTFHGVSDQLGLARAVTASLKPEGQFGIVNWHRRPLEETVVLRQPRGLSDPRPSCPGEKSCEVAGFFVREGQRHTRSGIV